MLWFLSRTYLLMAEFFCLSPGGNWSPWVGRWRRGRRGKRWVVVGSWSSSSQSHFTGPHKQFRLGHWSRNTARLCSCCHTQNMLMERVLIPNQTCATVTQMERVLFFISAGKSPHCCPTWQCHWKRALRKTETRNSKYSSVHLTHHIMSYWRVHLPFLLNVHTNLVVNALIQC